MGVREKRVTIIGGGIVGLCSAYYAVQKGYEVVVLERDSEEHLSASFGNAGMVVPSHFIPLAAPGMISKGLRWMLSSKSPFCVKPRLNRDLMRWGRLFWKHANPEHTEVCKGLLAEMSLRSRELFKELQKDLDFTLEKKGLLMLCKTQKTFDGEAKVAEMGAALGVKAEVCDAKRLSEIDPSIQMDVKGGVWFEQDCHLTPSEVMTKLRSKLESMGVEMIYNSEVVDIHVRNGVAETVELSNKEKIPCSQLLVTGGAWTSALLKSIGLRLPMEAGKGYSLTLPTPRVQPQLCSILCEAKVAVTPMDSQLRFAGTMEIGGLNLKVNKNRIQGIVNSVNKYFPEYSAQDFDGVAPWVGLRPCSPDGLPYLGRIPQASNVVVATGHGMMGVSLAPVTGQIVADLLDVEDASEQLLPNRFG
mgnify:CR=1 FL=1